MNKAAEPANLAAIGDRLVDLLATPMYYPCVLLSDPDVASLRSAARFLLSRFGWPELPVCGALCATQLDVPRKRRPRVAGQVLMQLELLDQRLDTILAPWHAALADALRSETAQHSIAAMTAQERQPLQAYLALPDPASAALPAGLAQAANQALRGIDTVSLAVNDLVEALKAGGLPCTVEQLSQRFANHVRAATSGHDPRNTRLTLAE